MKALSCTLILFLLPGGLFGDPAAKSRYADGFHVGQVLSGADLEDHTRFGWQGLMDLSERWSLAALVDYGDTELPEAWLAGSGLPPGSRVDLDVYAIALTARAHLWADDLQSWYVGAGGRYTIVQEEDDPINRAIAASGGAPVADASVEVHESFGVHALMGYERSLARHWEVFAEYTVVWENADVDLNLVNPQGRSTQVNRHWDLDHHLIRAGVNYRF